MAQKSSYLGLPKWGESRRKGTLGVLGGTGVLKKKGEVFVTQSDNTPKNPRASRNDD